MRTVTATIYDGTQITISWDDERSVEYMEEVLCGIMIKYYKSHILDKELSE